MTAAGSTEEKDCSRQHEEEEEETDNLTLFLAKDDNATFGGEGGVCSNFGGRPPGGEGASGRGGGAMRFPIACSRKWVSFLVHTLHLTIITPP